MIHVINQFTFILATLVLVIILILFFEGEFEEMGGE